jgi:hypothetical protein
MYCFALKSTKTLKVITQKLSTSPQLKETLIELEHATRIMDERQINHLFPFLALCSLFILLRLRWPAGVLQ